MGLKEALSYSFFGDPVIVEVGPTVNGQLIRVRVQPVNPVSGECIPRCTKRIAYILHLA